MRKEVGFKLYVKIFSQVFTKVFDEEILHLFQVQFLLTEFIQLSISKELFLAAKAAQKVSL